MEGLGGAWRGLEGLGGGKDKDIDKDRDIFKVKDKDRNEILRISFGALAPVFSLSRKNGVLVFIVNYTLKEKSKKNEKK